MKILQKSQVFIVGLMILCLFSLSTFANETSGLRFVTIILGTTGGLMEGNLSSYLLAPAGETDFIALDAGTILTGLQQAVKLGSFSDITLPEDTEWA